MAHVTLPTHLYVETEFWMAFEGYRWIIRPKGQGNGILLAESQPVYRTAGEAREAGERAADTLAGVHTRLNSSPERSEENTSAHD